MKGDSSAPAVIGLEYQKSQEDLSLRLPGSKSFSNRALIVAALCEGESILENLSESDDTLVLIDMLRSLDGPLRVTTSRSK